MQVYDLRTQKEVYALGGHTDTPVSLAVSPNGNFLLAPSLSSTTLVHDIRPFAPAAGGRVHRALTGAPAGFESTLLRGAWSRDDGGRRVAVGGADRTVCVWDVDSGKVLYKVGEVVHAEGSGLMVWLAPRTQGHGHGGGLPPNGANQYVCSLSSWFICLNAPFQS
jgi:WD40 repeat protein